MKIADFSFVEPPSMKTAVQSNKALIMGDDESDSSSENGFANAIRESWEKQSEYSAASRETTAQLLTGELDDLTGHLVAGEKSGLMFEYNLSVRNKLLDAYQEIIKTQV